jgi:hypothetical protein
MILCIHLRVNLSAYNGDRLERGRGMITKKQSSPIKQKVDSTARL